MNDTEVLHVSRKGDQAIHFIKEALPVGSNVKQTVDWKRRFDHMQQHSGQHLISAILERDFKYTTLSWWLGEDVCYVELGNRQFMYVTFRNRNANIVLFLDVPTVKDSEIEQVEETVNELIREARRVTVINYKEDTSEEELKDVCKII